MRATAEQVYRQARLRFDHVGAFELEQVYVAVPGTALVRACRVDPLPPVILRRQVAESLERAAGQAGPAADDLLGITVYDPACGTGMFLVEAARQLARAYATRLAAQRGGSDDQVPQLAEQELPHIVRTCVYGMDTDPLAVDLTRLALSLATDGQVTPATLRLHIVIGNRVAGDQPPAKHDRVGTIELTTALARHAGDT